MAVKRMIFTQVFETQRYLDRGLPLENSDGFTAFYQTGLLFRRHAPKYVLSAPVIYVLVSISLLLEIKK
jgi:hypothetical protein